MRSMSPHSVRLTVLCLLTGLICPAFSNGQGAQDYEVLRRRMVDEYLVREGITNERVLQAMRNTPRHQFVRADLRPLAYQDQALDIGQRQTISPPFIVAYMTEVLDPQPGDRVLEIGTGSGYQAAVLSPLVAEVYTIEIIETLGTRAERLLNRLGYTNIHVRIGDGYEGWPEQAPFDKIIVTCSPESIPQPLVDQLREGGRMIIPVGERYQQVFHLLQKENGQLVETKLLPTLFVPMTGQSEALREVQPDPRNPAIRNGSFEELLPDSDLLAGWHYQRRCTVMTGDDAPDGERYVRFQNETTGRNSHILQAFAVSGQAVQALQVQLRIRVGDVRYGTDPAERPGVVIHFFDQRRLPIAQTFIGPWLANTERWVVVDQRIVVPPTAQEAILQIGLNGARGVLEIDDLTIRPIGR